MMKPRPVLMVLAALAGGLLLAGCAPTPPPPLVPRDVAAAAPVNPAKPCQREAPPGPAAPAASSAGVEATYDRVLNQITVTGGDATIPSLAKLIDDPAALTQTAPGEWLLGATIEVNKGGSLTIAAPDVRWLKLAITAPQKFAALRAIGGRLDVSGSCVTSWNIAKKRASNETDYKQGRGFLLARDGAQMTIDKAEIRFLGYGDVESYGISWRTAGTTGALTNSIVSNMYYGMYSFEVVGLEVSDNDIYNSIVYGIDPHTGSSKLKILRNTVHDNGKHGIILAEDCTDSMISGNIVYNNAQHGIVLYLNSDHNTVEQNETFRNLDEGINVNESSNNTIRSNRIYENSEDGIGIGQGSKANTVEQNEIRGNLQDGVRLVSLAEETTVQNNVIGENVRYGIYIDSDNPFTIEGNQIFKSRTGVLITGTETLSTDSNTMYDNLQNDVKNS